MLFATHQYIWHAISPCETKYVREMHLLIHDYTWSKKGETWEKNIVNFFNDETKIQKKYLSKIILQWQNGLKRRKIMDKRFKKKFLI